MKIAISAESTVDIQKELLQQYDISVLPYGITLGDKSYFDGEIKAEEIYAYTATTKVLPKTSANKLYSASTRVRTRTKRRRYPLRRIFLRGG